MSASQHLALFPVCRSQLTFPLVDVPLTNRVTLFMAKSKRTKLSSAKSFILKNSSFGNSLLPFSSSLKTQREAKSANQLLCSKRNSQSVNRVGGSSTSLKASLVTGKFLAFFRFKIIFNSQESSLA